MRQQQDMVELGLGGHKKAPISKHRVVENLFGVERGHADRCFQVFGRSGLEVHFHFGVIQELLAKMGELLECSKHR
jgi:hypothetical protein